MPNFKKFSDYLTVREKPKDVGTLFTAQPKPPESEGQKGQVTPYKGNGEDAPRQKPEKGGLAAADGKLNKFTTGWTKTENFLNKTKDMSLQEFAAFMLEDCGCGQTDDLPMVTSYTAGKFHPHPPEAIKYVVVLADKNDRMMDHFVDEVKNNGSLGKLISKIFDRPESWEHMSDVLGDDDAGPSRANSFVRSMFDKYSKVMDDHESMFESVGPPIGKFSPDEDDDLEASDEAPPGDENDEDPDLDSEDDLDAEINGGEEDEDMPDDENDPDATTNMGDEDSSGDQGMPQGDEINGPKRLKKKMAFNHVIDSMRNYEPMKKYMMGS